jgi:hypothetical protein
MEAGSLWSGPGLNIGSVYRGIVRRLSLRTDLPLFYLKAGIFRFFAILRKAGNSSLAGGRCALYLWLRSSSVPY